MEKNTVQKSEFLGLQTWLSNCSAQTDCQIQYHFCSKSTEPVETPVQREYTFPANSSERDFS